MTKGDLSILPLLGAHLAPLRGHAFHLRKFCLVWEHMSLRGFRRDPTESPSPV
jgi:hypothetical protein